MTLAVLRSHTPHGREMKSFVKQRRHSARRTNEMNRCHHSHCVASARRKNYVLRALVL